MDDNIKHRGSTTRSSNQSSKISTNPNIVNEIESDLGKADTHEEQFRSLELLI